LDGDLFGGHRIERNRVRRVMRELSDGGGIYTLDWMPGTVVAGNLIEDLPKPSGRHLSPPLYADELTRAVVFRGNVLRRFHPPAMLIHCAGPLTVSDNLILMPRDGKDRRMPRCAPGDIEWRRNLVIQPDAIAAEQQKSIDAVVAAAGVPEADRSRWQADLDQLTPRESDRE
jgi:hypothetical protein